MRPLTELEGAPTVRPVAGNPPESPWRSTQQADRKRKKQQFTLSDDAVQALEELSKKRKQPKSVVIEALILAESAK